MYLWDDTILLKWQKGSYCLLFLLFQHFKNKNKNKNKQESLVDA
jgi:hypothetical protein